jgi:hypothetical protein
VVRQSLQGLKAASEIEGPTAFAASASRGVSRPASIRLHPSVLLGIAVRHRFGHRGCGITSLASISMNGKESGLQASRQ